MSIRRLEKGRRLRIRAADWNQIASTVEGIGPAVGGTSLGGVSQTIAFVRNDSDTDIDRGEILAIDGPLISRVENESEYLSRPTFSGIEPTNEHAGRFVIALEPMATATLEEGAVGEIGRCVVAGVTLAQIKLRHPSHRFADIDPGEHKAISGNAGAVSILSVEKITGTLTTRTSDTAGTLTMGSASHGLTEGQTVFILSGAGDIGTGTVGTVDGDEVDISDGAGAVLPAEDAEVTIVPENAWCIVNLAINDAGFELAEIQSVSTTTFSCKWVDRDGAAVGDAFDVHAYIYTDSDNLIGSVPLADCYPTPVAGQLLRVYRTPRVEFDGTEWVEGFWAVDRFDEVCEEA